MSSEPNINFGSPTIFFDSHPSEQESHIQSYWSSLKSSLYTAWTGDVPKFHAPGQLRIIWYTHDGARGFKDYELHEYAQVRDNFDVLLKLDDVRRVVIMGYSGQNPYVFNGPGGKNVWVEKFEREKRKGMKARAVQEKAEHVDSNEEKEKEKEKESKKIERLDNSKEGRVGQLVDIEDLIERSDRAEAERRKQDEEKIWKENEGLLSGEMV